MKRISLLLLIATQAFGIACSSQQQQAQSRVKRQPLEKQPYEYKSPTDYDLRDRGYNPKTGKAITYDHKPRIELIDAKSGKYAFKWIGYDGKEKKIIYQRADAVDVIVSAEASQTPDGKYLYTYKVETLPSSGTYLSAFIVQNFAYDTKPVEVGGTATNNRDLVLLAAFRNIPFNGESENLKDFHIGHMSNLIHQFKEGYWIDIAELNSENPQIRPGGTLVVKMLSSSPPDLVGCRVSGGELSVKGVGEHMPFVLENAMRGYVEYPYGYTIGPVDSVKSFSPNERAERMLKNLPQFKKLGWITDAAHQRYEKQLKDGNFDALSKQSEQDLKAEQITTEVFALIKTIK